MSIQEARRKWAQEGKRLQRIAEEERRAYNLFNPDLPPAMQMIAGEISDYDGQEAKRSWLRRILGL